MNFITSLLSLLFILLGINTTSKATLQKKPTKEDHIRSVNCWIQRNYPIIALAVLLIVLGVFVFVCLSVVGFSATESGTYYNQLNNII